jgi:hypothetical protein
MSKSVLESFEKRVEGGIVIKCPDHIFARVDLPRLDTMAEVFYEQFVEACKSKGEAVAEGTWDTIEESRRQEYREMAQVVYLALEEAWERE